MCTVDKKYIDNIGTILFLNTDNKHSDSGIFIDQKEEDFFFRQNKTKA